MAREVRFLTDMPDYLQNLLEETEDYLMQVKASDSYVEMWNHVSTSSKSFIWFNGEPLLPPLLSEEERKQMQEYKEAAVMCEQKMFDKRQQKYTGEILQAMAVMERIQKKEAQKSQNAPDLYARGDDSRRENPANRIANTARFDGRGEEWQRTNRTSVGETEYSPLLRTEHSMRVQLTNLRLHEESDPSGPLRDNVSRGHDHVSWTSQPDSSITRNPRESIASVNTTASSAVHMENWIGDFSQLPDQRNIQGVSASMGESMRGHSRASTVYEQSRAEVDSLASTSLSIAMTDTSFTSGVDNPRSAQRQLNLAAANDSPYNSDQLHITSASTPKESSSQQDRQKLYKDQKQEARFHDRSLDSLEIAKQKLLEEKQKQVTLLKQKELQRLRGVRIDAERSGSSESDDHKKRRSLTATGNMHGILDFSGTDHQRSASSVVQSVRSRSSLREIAPENCESEDRICSSVTQQDPSLKDEMFDVLQHNASAESNSGHSMSSRALESHKRHSLQGDSSLASEDFKGMSSDGTTGTNVWRQRPYSIAAMEFGDGEFSNYTELDSASDKENQQTGVLHRDNRKKHADGGALVLSGRDELLLRNGGQDFTGGRSKFALVSACAKGFLARCLLKCDKVQAMVKTIKDTKEFLSNIASEESQSFQDKSLQERVETQLRAARYSLHDIFHKIPIHEQMAYIAHSRSLARERETKRHSKSADSRSKLSTATVRAMLRRQEGQIPETVEQKKPAANPLGRKTWNIRVLKPMQGNASPPRPDVARSKRQAKRPTTAPERSLAEKRKGKGERPQTTETALPSTNRGDNKPNKQSGRVGVGGNAYSGARRGVVNSAAYPENLQFKRSTRKMPENQEQLSEVKRHVTRVGSANERPRTASLVKKSSRTVAAKFNQKLSK